MLDIIDAIGALDVEAKALRDRRAELVKLLEDVEAGRYEGLSHALTIVEKVDWRLKTADVKAEMGEDWYNARCKQSFSRSVRSVVL
jgi:hypothetical protein